MHKLPEVNHALPWILRLVLVAIGIAVIVLPARDLGRGLWPPSLMRLLVGVIVVGAAMLGLLLMALGVFGEAQRWSYPPRTVVIHRRRWGAERATRLMAGDVAGISVRHKKDAEAPDTWRVVLMKHDCVPLSRAQRRIFKLESALETHDFKTLEQAAAARSALLEHLGLRQ